MEEEVLLPATPTARTPLNGDLIDRNSQAYALKKLKKDLSSIPSPFSVKPAEEFYGEIAAEHPDATPTKILSLARQHMGLSISELASVQLEENEPGFLSPGEKIPLLCKALAFLKKSKAPVALENIPYVEGILGSELSDSALSIDDFSQKVALLKQAIHYFELSNTPMSQNNIGIARYNLAVVLIQEAPKRPSEKASMTSEALELLRISGTPRATATLEEIGRISVKTTR